MLVATSCMSPSVVSDSQSTYKDQSLSHASLMEGGAAILPIVAGDGVEGFRRPYGDALYSALDSIQVLRKSGMEVVGWRQTLDAINNAGLTQDYDNAIASYERSAILDKATLGSLSEAVGVRYLVYVKLEYERSVHSSGLENTQIAGNTQLWDGQLGDVVYEGAVYTKAIRSAIDTEVDVMALSREGAEELALIISDIR